MPYPIEVRQRPDRTLPCSVHARVKIIVTPAIPVRPDLHAAWITVEYSDNGVEWAHLRGAVEVPYYGVPVTVYDHEIPSLQRRWYRARTRIAVEGGGNLASQPCRPQDATLRLCTVWLKDPLAPDQNFTLPVETKWIDITEARARTVLTPLGRSKPVVVAGAERGQKFKLTWTLVGDEAIWKMQDILREDKTLLLQNQNRNWYVQLADDLSIQEDLFSPHEPPARQVTATFVEVDY